MQNDHLMRMYLFEIENKLPYLIFSRVRGASDFMTDTLNPFKIVLGIHDTKKGNKWTQVNSQFGAKQCWVGFVAGA